MRAVGLALVVLLVLGVLVLVPNWSGTRAPHAALVAAPEGTGARLAPADEERLSALERRVDELALTLGALSDTLARLQGAQRAPMVEEAPAPPATSETAEHGPAWYLEQYEASFVNGSEGSEYFRLAVEAFAPSLLREIGAIVLDARANTELRLKLVAMLGDARFRGRSEVLDVLLRVVSMRAVEGVGEAALDALAHIGDTRTARALEGLVWSIEARDVRWKAVQVLVALAGPEANAALVRLWPRAMEDNERALLIGLAQPNEGESALELFELAALGTQPMRLQAAKAVGRFRFPAFPPFIAAWRAREPDDEVRAALGAAEEAQRETPRWGAARAAGAPDANSLDDDPNAWASAQPDMGAQWLDLSYEPARVASGVRIHEVCVPGAVAALVALDERGGRHELWSGVDPTLAPGVFALDFGATAFRVRSLRLTLDTNRRPGWSEIDAVELVGPEDNAWANSASASSSYGR